MRPRRPRTGGFLAGHFYAATAGAFSATNPEAIGDEVKSLAVAFTKRLIDKTK